MVDNKETYRSAEAVRKSDAANPDVRPPPRPVAGEPAGDVAADVRIRQTADERLKVDINTGETAGRGGWPSEEDWKRWLKAAAPWLVAAAVITLGASAYNKKREEEGEEGLGDAAKRKGRQAKDKAGRAAEDAADSAKRGWFGLKRGADEAANQVEGAVGEAKGKAGRALDETRGKAGRVAEDTKESASSGWFGVKRRAEDAADEAGDKWVDTKDAAARKGREAKDSAKGYVARTEDYVADKARDTREGARHMGHAVEDKLHGAAETTKHAAHVTADASRRATGAVEDTAVKAGSKVLAKASEAEEVTGTAMKEAGDRLEKDGERSKRYYRGETEPKRRKWFGLF